MKKILILGANGFIGNQLVKQLLKTTPDWEIYGLDLCQDRLEHSLNNPRFHFKQGDINVDQAWINQTLQQCEVILPLVAVATPATYVQDPLKVFELDFEANLPIVRQCVQYDKRLIFPSTSEVYGMSPDQQFDEEHSPLMQGPINKERWIYSSAKQLMDRVIYAYGKHRGLRYTLFRPFNWIGPTQDYIHRSSTEGVRVVTQFIGNILRGEDLKLVDGGQQRRCFTYIDDAIDALIKIIENPQGKADGKIFNIGNPANDASIAELAQQILAIAQEYPHHRERVSRIKAVEISSRNYYGEGYQDVSLRVPAIHRIREAFGWQPTTDLETALRKTVAYYLEATQN